MTDGINFMAQKKQRKQPIAMIVLLRFSNQYNAYNPILWLIAIALEYVQITTETTQK